MAKAKTSVQYVMAPYGRRVRLYLTAKAFERTLKKLGYPQSGGGYLGITYNTPKAILMFVKDGNPLTLLHECTHSTMLVLEHVGVDPTDGRGEPMAYHLAHMYGHFLPHLPKRK